MKKRKEIMKCPKCKLENLEDAKFFNEGGVT